MSISLFCIGAAGCADDLKVPNQDARIIAVGQISPPVEGCSAGASAAEDQDENPAAQPDAQAVDYYLPEMARDRDSLAIPYLIMDREADDQQVRVEICGWQDESAVDCGVAVMGPGGDGASSISTAPAGQCVLHVFNWDAGCGRFIAVEGAGAPPKRATPAVDEPLVARIGVVDVDEPPILSAPFTLSEVGFDTLSPCD